ncbi:MAG: TetR/AcrR family transcriptional regulator [Lachnospiraceae bacterium]|nr:TetR/AcrR family transcriptional regulator [Lachnospiraceae bacterium]
MIKNRFLELYYKNGLDGISTTYLCTYCNISRTIFYRYFDDKYDVLESIEHEYISLLKEANDTLRTFPIRASNNKEELFPFINEVLNVLDQNRLVYKALLGPNASNSFALGLKQQIKKDLIGKFEYDQISRDIDFTAEISAATFVSIYRYWLLNRADLPKSTIAEMCTKVVLKPLYY